MNDMDKALMEMGLLSAPTSFTLGEKKDVKVKQVIKKKKFRNEQINQIIARSEEIEENLPDPRYSQLYNSRGQKLGKHSIIKNPEQNFTTHRKLNSSIDFDDLDDYYDDDEDYDEDEYNEGNEGSDDGFEDYNEEDYYNEEEIEKMKTK